jgi:uncharacterized protein
MTRIALASLLLSVIGLAWASPQQLVDAARSQVGVTVTYDPSYQRLKYPGGDVPLERGVCTDVVVRAYRKLGIDLQELVHKDMKRAWSEYPHPARWGLRKPDPHIDHRRVPNLRAFFQRHGTALGVTRDAGSFRAGDVVTWELPGGLPHIGIVADQASARGTPLIVHNIGRGARIEDMLFAYRITGHYRYPAQGASAVAQ